MKLSQFGTKLTSKTGILQLMDDLGAAMAEKKVSSIQYPVSRIKTNTEIPNTKYQIPDTIMLGGGNPSHIPAMQAVFRTELESILQNPGAFESMIGNYVTPQGDIEFTKTLAKFFHKTYGWSVGPENIFIGSGSQSAFFFLFNMLAGAMPDGSFRKVLFPLVPEYIGYADQGIAPDMFAAIKPTITSIDEHTFKYGIDFKNLNISNDIAAICVSRPTNPTGNVLTDTEIDKLLALAKQHDIPLIVDNAYGLPFPGIIFTDAKPYWDESIIYSMSLSKIGLPGTRNSIIIAKPEIVKHLSAIAAIVNLSPGTIGQYMIKRLVDSGEILQLSKTVIQPYYAAKSQKAVAAIHASFDPKLPYKVHVSEGALFLWLWFADMPISTIELYNRLKKRNVIVVPGEYFFPGFTDNWRHTQECIRMTYIQDEVQVAKGIKIIAEEVSKAYGRSES